MPSDIQSLIARVEAGNLARLIDACVEDALRPVPVPGHPNTVQGPDHRTICLANGLRAISAALRAKGTDHAE